MKRHNSNKRRNVIDLLEKVTLLLLLLAPISLINVSVDMIYPHVTSKNLLWRTIISLACASWASLAFLEPRYRITIKHPIILLFSAYVFIMLITTITGVDPHRSFWSTATRMDGYITVLYMFVAFITAYGFLSAYDENKGNALPIMIWIALAVIMASFHFSKLLSLMHGDEKTTALLIATVLLGGVGCLAFQDRKIITTFLHSLLALGVFMGVIAFFDIKVRADATLGNPIYFASYISLSFLTCCYFLLEKQRLFDRKGLRQSIYGALMVFFIIVLFDTSTRAPVFGLMVGGFTMSSLLVVFAQKSDERIWRWLSIGIIAFIITSVVAFVSFKGFILESDFFGDESLLKRAAGTTLQDYSTASRFANWAVAIEGFKERPILGWGLENFSYVVDKHYVAPDIYKQAEAFDRSHNMFTDLLVFGGALGFSSFLLLMVGTIWVLWSRTGDNFTTLGRSAITGIVVCYLAQNFFAFDSVATNIWIILILLWVSLNYVSPKKNATNAKPWSIPFAVQMSAISILWLATGVWLFFSVWQPAYDLRVYARFLSAPTAGQTRNDKLQADFVDLEQLLNSVFKQEVLFYTLRYRDTYLKSNLDPEIIRKYANFLETYSKELIDNTFPYDMRLSVFYATYLMESGHYKEAQDYFERALANSREGVIILSSLAHVHSSQKNYQDALTYYQRAFDLLPHHEYAGIPKESEEYKKTVPWQYKLIEDRIQELKKIIDANS